MGEEGGYDFNEDTGLWRRWNPRSRPVLHRDVEDQDFYDPDVSDDMTFDASDDSGNEDTDDPDMHDEWKEVIRQRRRDEAEEEERLRLVSYYIVLFCNMIFKFWVLISSRRLRRNR